MPDGAGAVDIKYKKPENDKLDCIEENLEASGTSCSSTRTFKTSTELTRPFDPADKVEESTIS